jgi:hypothetical protein
LYTLSGCTTRTESINWIHNTFTKFPNSDNNTVFRLLQYTPNVPPMYEEVSRG